MLKNANLLDYWKDKQQVNWCRVTASKNQMLNRSIPILNQLLTGQRISTSDSHADSSILSLGDSPQHFLMSCYQNINQDTSISDMNVVDFSNLTLDQIVDKLNLLKINVPMNINQLEKNINTKFFTQRVPSKSVIASEDIWRYVDNIQIVALYEDLLKPSKEFLMDKIIPVFDEILSSVHSSDMTKQISDLTNYDLSSIYLLNNKDFISFDKSDHIISNHIVNIQDFINDFTNIFIDKTIHLTKDETYIDHTVIGSNIVAQTKAYHAAMNYLVGSHFDSEFILMKENIFGDRTSSIYSYIVPIQMDIVLPDRIPSFFITNEEGANEQLRGITIPYGTYIRDILRFYYGFNDGLVRYILQLILAWVIRNASEDPLISEVNELLTGLLGTPSNVKWNGIIKTLEQTIMSDFSDMTGSNHPMIYHTTHMDVTSKNMNNSFYQTLDDLYTLITQLNYIQFVFMFDMGYNDNLNMRPMAAIVSKDKRFVDSGYLSMFTASNKINL